MKKLFVFGFAAALLMAFALPVGATPPAEVNFEVEASMLGDPSPFAASGPAVDDGLVCGSGLVVDVEGRNAGASPTGFNYRAIQQFSCEDGSGEFFVNYKVRIDYRRGTSFFNWNILSGTGDYEDLHGAGSGFGLLPGSCGADCVLNLYTGGLHIDP